MKKRLITAALAFSIFAAGIPALASQNEENIQVSLTVGESGVTVNGEQREAEAAYLTENGVTMVPLRVLTEAFGASVDWTEESRTVTVRYEDVIVVMTIGEIHAQVNDHTQQMPAAPVISEAGITMIPLRFLAETLGAEVSYTDGVVHITKTALQEGNIVQHQITAPRFGDSSIGWSMDVASDYSLTSEQNGAATFTGKSYNAYYRVESQEKKEDFELEKRFETSKLSADQSYIVTEAVLETDVSGAKYYKISAKNRVNRRIERVYETKNHIILVTAQIGLTPEDHSADVEMILDSFQLQFGDVDETYDLYKKPSEMVRISNDDYGLTLQIPASWEKLESLYVNAGKPNELLFVPKNSKDQSQGGIKVYSKTKGQSAQELIQQYYERFVQCYNPELVQVGEIITEPVSGYDGYTCTVRIQGGHNIDGTMKVAAVEVGDYIYFIYLRLMDKTEDEKAPEGQEQIRQIFDTFEMQQLEYEETGDLMYMGDGHELTEVYEEDAWRMVVPLSWKRDYLLGAFMLEERNTGAALLFMPGKQLGIKTEEDLKGYIQEQLEEIEDDEEYRIIDSGSVRTIGDREYYGGMYRYQPEEGPAAYNYIYGFMHNKKLYVFIVQTYEEYSGGRTDQEAKDIMASLEMLK